MMRGMIPIYFVAAVAIIWAIRFEMSVSFLSQSLVPPELLRDNDVPVSSHELVEDEPSTRPSEVVLPENDALIVQNEGRQRPKKFYAIHIGPSKTGTSAIQLNMARNPFRENTFGADKDNLIYVGKRKGNFDNWQDEYGNKEIRRIKNINETIYTTPKNENKAYHAALKCMGIILDKYYDSNTNSTTDKSVINERLENKEDRTILRQQFLDECWIREGIDFTYMLDSSIVDSNEAYSYTQMHGDNGRRFRLFHILGYETIVVVGAYRRYADWLVSAYTQSIKKGCIFPNLEGLKKEESCIGFKKFLSNHMRSTESGNYRVRQMYDPISITLPESIERGPSKLQAKVLNYFQLPHSSSNPEDETSGFKAYNSITTELYCEAFGENLTPHSCSHAQKNSRKEKHKKNSSLVANKGDLADSVYQNIVATGYRYGFLLFTEQELQERQRKCQAESRFWCDFVRKCTKEDSCTKETKRHRELLDQITLSGKNTIVGTSTSNVAMFTELSDYHSKIHDKIWTGSLPIKCPTREILDKLLKKSLAFEELVMPEFYASSMGREEHIRLFWDVWLKEKKLFCWVDTMRLFQGATSWDEIINKRMVSYNWGEPIEEK